MPIPAILFLMVICFIITGMIMVAIDGKNDKAFLCIVGGLTFLVGLWISFYGFTPWRIVRTEIVQVQTTKDGTEQFVIVETERKIHKIYTLERFGHIIPKGVAVKVSYHDMGSYCGILPDSGQSFSLSLSKEGD